MSFLTPKFPAPHHRRLCRRSLILAGRVAWLKRLNEKSASVVVDVAQRLLLVRLVSKQDKLAAPQP